MEDRVRTMLSSASSAYTDAEIEEAILNATMLVNGYTMREVDGDGILEMCVAKLAVVNLNRRNTEGLASTSSAGVSESYADLIPNDIKSVLDRKRRAILV